MLYDEAIRLANLTGVETVIDAYCGTGTIGLVAASRGAARVIGVDSVEAAIRDAANNARHNGVENAEFVAQDATAFMKELAASEERPQPSSCSWIRRGPVPRPSSSRALRRLPRAHRLASRATPQPRPATCASW